MIYYKNSDPKKNIGRNTGKKFVVFFLGKASYNAYEDGTIKLIKEDSGDDREVFESGVLTGEILKLEVIS